MNNRPRWRGLMQSLDYDKDIAPIFDLMGYRPHAAQEEIHRDRSQTRTVCCGRRFGKSYCAGAEAVLCAVLGGGVWAVAPDYELSSIVFEEALGFITNSPLATLLAGEPRIARGRQAVFLETGGFILGKSSHKPRSLLGRGLDLVIDDEAATEDNAEIYHQYFLPVLLDRVGSFLPISTPRGENWFWEVFMKGKENADGFASFHYPTTKNPELPRVELQKMVEPMPQQIYEQEILAKFLQDTGAIFRGYRKVMQSDPWFPIGSDWRPGFYVCGVDLGRHEDYTVVSVWDALTGEEVYLERVNKLDWDAIEEVVVRIQCWFRAPAYIDKTGAGDRVVDMIAKKSPFPVEGHTFTNLSKITYVQQLQLAIQQQTVTLLRREAEDCHGKKIGAIAASEMSQYRYEKTKGGLLTMNAPPNKHDDIVTARILGLQACIKWAGGNFLESRKGVGHAPTSRGGEEERPSLHGQFSKKDPAPKVSKRGGSNFRSRKKGGGGNGRRRR